MTFVVNLRDREATPIGICVFEGSAYHSMFVNNKSRSSAKSLLATKIGQNTAFQFNSAKRKEIYVAERTSSLVSNVK